VLKPPRVLALDTRLCLSRSVARWLRGGTKRRFVLVIVAEVGSLVFCNASRRIRGGGGRSIPRRHGHTARSRVRYDAASLFGNRAKSVVRRGGFTLTTTTTRSRWKLDGGVRSTTLSYARED
jgi:hypothetical protein